jgi:hypothetical protein
LERAPAAKPPTISFDSVKGPSVTVNLVAERRPRTLCVLGRQASVASGAPGLLVPSMSFAILRLLRGCEVLQSCKVTRSPGQYSHLARLHVLNVRAAEFAALGLAASDGTVGRRYFDPPMITDC